LELPVLLLLWGWGMGGTRNSELGSRNSEVGS
jgi:hypothetical protein